MSFRTIAISRRAKLSLSMGYMEVRTEDTLRVFLDDIDILIIESQAVSLTAALLSALMKKKIKIIFCDEKRNPQGELLPYYGSNDTSRKIKNQIAWTGKIKCEVWTEIVREKIKNQMLFLEELHKTRETLLLEKYISELMLGDITNREGLAAKVYFDAIFGMDFKRSDEIPANAALNYGYSLLLSLVNKEIIYNGYTTALGLSHDNIYNPFNLSSDLMEPFRILVDRIVYENKFEKFTSEEKHVMLRLLETEVEIDNCIQVLPNAIRIYVRSIFNALIEDEISEISFYAL